MMVTSRLLGTLLAQVFFISGQDILRGLLNLLSNNYLISYRTTGALV